MKSFFKMPDLKEEHHVQKVKPKIQKAYYKSLRIYITHGREVALVYALRKVNNSVNVRRLNSAAIPGQNFPALLAIPNQPG